MNGFDISNHQKNINVSKVASDFVIIKATQGTSYVSPSFKKQITESINAGRLVGVYHYASTGGAIPEAEHFLKTVKDYIGKAILCLDWEGKDNPNFTNPSYAMAWLRYVAQKTNVLPFIYMSKSVCRQYKTAWDPMFPLWCAQYANKLPCIGYKLNPWTDDKGFGPWAHCQILQYSSTGRLAGFLIQNLDLDKAYITSEQWRQYAQGIYVAPISSVPANWEIGKVYTTNANLNIRTAPNGSRKLYNQITANAKQHAYNDGGFAVLKSGTRVTIKEIIKLETSTWLRIPSGWICGNNAKTKYVI